VRPLRAEGSRFELPLWRLPREFGRARVPVWSDELGAIPEHELAPRALLMTALVRMSMCDLFIHGTGGGVYDRITELWLDAWLPGTRLAPTAVVTATRRLPFDLRVRTPEEIAHAAWRSHHALHSPAMLGDAAAEGRRRELVTTIKTARARGRDPRDAFDALHRFLDDVRARRPGPLATVQQEAAQARADEDLARVVHDRTWPFPLYGPGTMDDLKREIDGEFGLGAGHRTGAARS
jgi:hypothetical protein